MVEVNLDNTLRIFRAIGEETRLRIAVLLSYGELTVTEITQVLGQSQPRVSRHIKILAEAGVVERYPEGAWVFYRLLDDETVSQDLNNTLSGLKNSGDRVLARDRERLGQVQRARAELAASYFQENANEWDTIRSLHLPESDIEQAMRDLLGPQQVKKFVDLGTGTGRILIVLKELYEEGVGYDLSHDMLSVARAKLSEEEVSHAIIRQGDLFSLPMEQEQADVVCLHQVLHYLSDPVAAIESAADLLKEGGRMIIVDFASHELEFLREKHAHRRLGFSEDEVSAWAKATGLEFVRNVTLAPSSSEQDKLTVKLWLLTKSQGKQETTKKRIGRKVSHG